MKFIAKMNISKNSIEQITNDDFIIERRLSIAYYCWNYFFSQQTLINLNASWSLLL